MKKIVYIILLLIPILFNCSKNGSNNGLGVIFILEGTVYIDDEPRSNVMVEFSSKPAKYYTTEYGANISRYTDQNGKYNFSETTGSRISYAIMYRVRIKNPLTGLWLKYREGNVPADVKKIEDFYIYSE